MNDDQVFRGAIEVWSSRGVPLIPGHHPSAVEALFHDLGRPLSADILAYDTLIGDFADEAAGELGL